MSSKLIAILAVLGLFLAYAAYKLALFSKASVTRSSLPEMKIAYSVKTGQYCKTWKESFRIEDVLEKKFGVKKGAYPCIGIYFDDPKVVPENECRAVIGKVLPEDFSNTDEIEDVKFGKIEEMKDVVKVTYPLRSHLGLIFGLSKIYGKMTAYMNSELKGKETTAPMELYGYEKGSIVVVSGVGKFGGLISLLPPMKK